MSNFSDKQLKLLSFLNSYTLHHSGLNSDNLQIAEQAIIETRYTLRDVLSALDISLTN